MSTNDSGQEEDKEFKRLNSYASALLIAIPIILGVTTLDKIQNSDSTAFSVVSIIAVLIAVFATVL